MKFAEECAIPVAGELGTYFTKRNDLSELFYIRWGRIRFDVFWGVDIVISPDVDIVVDRPQILDLIRGQSIHIGRTPSAFDATEFSSRVMLARCWIGRSLW